MRALLGSNRRPVLQRRTSAPITSPARAWSARSPRWTWASRCSRSQPSCSRPPDSPFCSSGPSPAPPRPWPRLRSPRRASARRNVLPGRRRHRRCWRSPWRAGPSSGGSGTARARSRSNGAPVAARWRDRAHELAPAGGGVAARACMSRRALSSGSTRRTSLFPCTAARHSLAMSSWRWAAGPPGRSRTRWTHAPVDSPPSSSR